MYYLYLVDIKKGGGICTTTHPLVSSLILNVIEGMRGRLLDADFHRDDVKISD